jgi:kynureninase
MTDFNQTRAQFILPEGKIYLDGNSLGPVPVAAAERLQKMLSDEWGTMLIGGWSQAGWMDMSFDVGNRIAKLIGAAERSIAMGDTLSLKVYQALAAALQLNPGRSVILSDTGNFPSDLYIAQGLVRSLDRGLELRTVPPAEIEQALTDDVAVLMLTEVDYQTGRLHDMAALTDLAHQKGIITVWDLAHSTGAIPVDLGAANADIAIGCTYKYLNGGPGAPAFIYVNPAIVDRIQPTISGWLGHQNPFDFSADYAPGPGIERMRVGTPPVIALNVLNTAMDVFDHVDMADVRRQSIKLSELLIAEVATHCPSLLLISPTDPMTRGSQVSFAHQHGYAIMKALIDRGVIGDFRAPDAIRFGLAPLYISEADVRAAVVILADILDNRLWDRPEYQVRAAIT